MPKPIETRSAYYVNSHIILAILAGSEEEALALSRSTLLALIDMGGPGSATLFAVNRPNTSYITRVTPPLSPVVQMRRNKWEEEHKHLDIKPPMPPDCFE